MLKPSGEMARFWVSELHGGDKGRRSLDLYILHLSIFYITEAELCLVD